MTEEDEREVALFPVGHRFALIIIGYTKWALAACRLVPKDQLSMLESLAGLLNPRALAEVRPCCDVSRRMIETALSNDDDSKLSRSFGILTGGEVFRELLRLNPSWLRAVWLCNPVVRKAVA